MCVLGGGEGRGGEGRGERPVSDGRERVECGVLT